MTIFLSVAMYRFQLVMDGDLHSAIMHPLLQKKEVSLMCPTILFYTISFLLHYSAVPANLSAPLVNVLSATSIYILWTEPNQPNGVIISYTIFL